VGCTQRLIIGALRHIEGISVGSRLWRREDSVSQSRRDGNWKDVAGNLLRRMYSKVASL
jgi:hypothetical protein